METYLQSSPQVEDSTAAWLSQITQMPGLLAAVTLSPGDACHTLAARQEYTAEIVEQLLRHLAETARGLDSHRLAPSQMHWSYANARLHLGIRPDGTHLLLITATQAEAPPADLIEQLFSAFEQA